MYIHMYMFVFFLDGRSPSRVRGRYTQMSANVASQYLWVGLHKYAYGAKDRAANRVGKSQRLHEGILRGRSRGGFTRDGPAERGGGRNSSGDLEDTWRVEAGCRSSRNRQHRQQAQHF